MTVVRKANESQQSEWREVPEGLWRWRLGKPELTFSDKFGKWSVKFPLFLTDAEKARLDEELGAPPDGTQQSYRTYYRANVSLGWTDKRGVYQSTNLINVLAAALGSANSRRFREWIAAGGGWKGEADLDQPEGRDTVLDWLGWWEDLEVYGTASHRAKDDGSGVWVDFTSPLPVGSLPGQKDDDYQALGKGKLRAMMAEVGATPTVANGAAKPVPRTYEQAFDVEADEAPPKVKDGPPGEGPFACEECGTELKDTRFKDGTAWSSAQLAGFGRRKHGKVLCMDHYRAENEGRRTALVQAYQSREAANEAPPNAAKDGPVTSEDLAQVPFR